APAAVAENVPQREVKLSFATIAPPPGSIVLRGSRPDASVEFGMRSDELVANALLNLESAPAAVAENVPQREVKLSFATIAPPPGSIVLRG
ncbi:hypothetical protein CKQ90_31900, partial [Klebsiella pneumoniae]